jgi:hypothetical protein
MWPCPAGCAVVPGVEPAWEVLDINVIPAECNEVHKPCEVGLSREECSGIDSVLVETTYSCCMDAVRS